MSWIIRDFLCDECSTVHEALEDRALAFATHPCPMCGAMAKVLPSAPKPKVLTAAPTAATRGLYESRPGPAALDTRPIAEGKMTVAEWKKKRSEMWRDRARAKDLGHRDKLTVRR
jgi:hypothetical protein